MKESKGVILLTGEISDLIWGSNLSINCHYF